MLLRPPGGGWKPDKRLKTVWGVDAFETRYLSTAQSRAKTRIRAVLNRKESPAVKRHGSFRREG